MRRHLCRYMGMWAQEHLLEAAALAQGEMRTTSHFISTSECLEVYSQCTRQRGKNTQENCDQITL